MARHSTNSDPDDQPEFFTGELAETKEPWHDNVPIIAGAIIFIGAAVGVAIVILALAIWLATLIL